MTVVSSVSPTERHNIDSARNVFEGAHNFFTMVVQLFEYCGTTRASLTRS